MPTRHKAKRPIGRILVDGGFLSPPDITAALEEQKHTSELLGQVLVRMGVAGPVEIKAVLSLQSHLDRVEDMIWAAAGVRQMLGALLVQAGQITNEQLEQALVEQKKSGERLGEVLVRLRLLTAAQLDGVLDFQRKQGEAKPSSGPLRLGELLVSTGAITRSQLEIALLKQDQSKKKIGEVLVEEGYALPHHVKRGIRLQHMLLTAALVALLAACGSGGGAADTSTVSSGASGTSASSSNVAQDQSSANYLTVTQDDYGLKKPNFFYSTNNNAFWSIQADIADGVWDPNFKTVMRIDIQKSADGSLPGIGGKTYSIEDNGPNQKFPGTFLVFNGEKSTLKKVESGTLAFTPDTVADDMVNGSFDVVLVDYDSGTLPAPTYHLKGVFNFRMGTYGPAGAMQTPEAQ